MNQFPFTNYKKVSFNALQSGAPVTKYTTTANSLIVVQYITGGVEYYNVGSYPQITLDDNAATILYDGVVQDVGPGYGPVNNPTSNPTVVSSGIDVKYRGNASFPPTSDYFVLHIFELPE